MVILAFFGAFGFSGCASQKPVPQYAEDLTFSVLHLQKIKGNDSPSLDAERARSLNAVLTNRNLKISSIDYKTVENDLALAKTTEEKVERLRKYAQGTQFVLLSEITPKYYSQVSELFHWNVKVHLSLYDLSTQKSVDDVYTATAVLTRTVNEATDADEAVTYAMVDIEKHMGKVIDAFLNGHATNGMGMPEAPVSEDAPAPDAVPAVENAPAPAPEAAPVVQAAPQAPVVSQSVSSPVSANVVASSLGNNVVIPDGMAAPGDAIYYIMVDRFFNAQDNTDDVDLFDKAGWHGGDLEGIRLKLPWLQSLGITKLWLSPVFTAAHKKFFGHGAFHGYWTYDLSTIDVHFGTEKDLQTLAAEAKNYGIEIILDFVVNHVGYEAPLVEQKPLWFHPAKTIENWDDPDQLVNYQVHGLPDLDQSKAEVYAYITNAAWKWIAIPNIAGFRLDAVKHVDINFWKRFNQEIKSGKRNAMLIGEYFDGNPKKVDDIQKNGQFTQMFDFPLSFALRDVFCENKSLAALAGVITNDRQYSSPNDMVTFLDNHDMPRFLSLCHDNTDAMGRALRVMLAWRGIPSLYYGTETPLAGMMEPDNRADMNFDSATLFPLIQSALRLRSQNPVFAKGATATLEYQPGFVVFGREYKDSQALIIINQNASSQMYRLPAGKWRDAETNRQQNGLVTAKPNTVMLLLSDGNSNALIDHSMRRVTFKLPNDGRTYAIAGSTPELGQWNPKEAPSGGTEITVELPTQTVVTYKLVRLENDGNVTWSSGDNRELFVTKDTAVDVVL